MSSLRLIPVVVFAATSLLAIKAISFVAVGPVQSTWQIEGEVRKRVAGVPAGVDPIVTGATPEAKPATPQKAAPQPAGQQVAQASQKGAPPAGASQAVLVKGQPVPRTGESTGNSPSERALIERLQERRQELEARARDLEMREALMKAAEKQIDSRLGELKGAEEGKTEATDRIKSLVVMYESMGPKEAARIFDRLDPRTLVDLVNHMNPRKVSEIMAKMQPEAAERMTLELARGGKKDQGLPPSDLRRIGAQNTR